MDVPRRIDLAMPMSESAWADYYNHVWTSRLDALAAVRYWARVGEALRAIDFTLQLVVTLGALSAVASLLDGVPRAVFVTVSLVVAVCSGTLQVTRLRDHREALTQIMRKLNERVGFWEDAWTIVRGGHYAGTISELGAGDAALHQQLAPIPFGHVRRWARRAQDDVIRTDHLIPRPA